MTNKPHEQNEELLVDQTERLHYSIVKMYPYLAEQSVTLDLQFNTEHQEWSIDLVQENHHLKSYITTAEAEGLISGIPCESLEMQLGLITLPII